MPDDLPDLLFLGDSHSLALEEGARALGLRTESVSFGGSAWADGKFGWGDDGFNPRGSVQGRRALNALRERFGVKNVFGLGIPVVTTAGFHLGRLLRPFDWFGHRAMGANSAEPESGLVVSDAMLGEYISHFRGPHIRLLKKLSREAKVVAIAPPEINREQNFWPLREKVIGQMRGAGIDVFDPFETLFEKGEVLAQHLIAEDGAHATAEYGQMVMNALRESGWPD